MMRSDSFAAIARVLNQANVPYIVVGGLAVIAHGYGRPTQDVDLVIRLDPTSINNAFAALSTIGYLPRVPIKAADFADPLKRAEWIESKGMKVLNFFSDEHKETMLDVFIKEPFDFSLEYEAAVQDNANGIPLRILRLPTLLQMKREAGRLQDLADVDRLTLLHNSRK